MNDLIIQDLIHDNICGEDYKYEEKFLQIEQEIDKTYSVTQDGPTNWEFVIKNSEEILKTKSKDIKLASWWLLGNWKVSQFTDFEDNLETYTKLLEKYKSDLYPKSIKAKLNTFFWLEDNLIKDLNIFESNKNNIKNVILLWEFFIKTNNLINEITKSKSNFFKKIINFLEPLAKEEEEIKNKEQKSENNSNIYDDNKTKNNLNNSLILNETNEIQNDADAVKVLRNIKNSSTMLSTYYRKKSFSDLKALRITRFLCWLDTEGLPYSENKKTFLHPPSELEIDDLLDFYKNKNYDRAFNLVEEILEVSPFWIDGHFYAYDILDKTEHYDEAKEVKNTILSFIKTNEGILDLFFTDNTPFASNKTKKWIKENSFVEEKKVTEQNKTDVKEEKLEKIYGLANNDKLKESMLLLEKEYLTSNSVEEKFNWRLYHAQLAIEFEKKDIALALLEELEKEITYYHLDEWNPKLASKVYNLLLSSFTSIDIPHEKIEVYYKKLCKTDISNALEININ